MDSVLRATVIYLLLFVFVRLSGKRTLAQITPFDFVLLLVIGEATQQGLLGNDFSITNALLVVITLLGLDVAVTLVRERVPLLERMWEGMPVILLEDGRPFEDRMRKARVDVPDILEQARQSQGLERLDQIKYAVLERSGGISIIPKGSEG